MIWYRVETVRFVPTLNKFQIKIIIMKLRRLSSLLLAVNTYVQSKKAFELSVFVFVGL